jgi:hypothetical protein
LFVLASQDGLEAAAVPRHEAAALLRVLADAELALVRTGALDRDGSAS